MVKKEMSEQQYDLRLVRNALRNGSLDRKEYEAYLKKLPDDEPFADYIDVAEQLTSAESDDSVGPTFTSG